MEELKSIQSQQLHAEFIRLFQWRKMDLYICIYSGRSLTLVLMTDIPQPLEQHSNAWAETKQKWLNLEEGSYESIANSSFKRFSKYGCNIAQSLHSEDS